MKTNYKILEEEIFNITLEIQKKNAFINEIDKKLKEQDARIYGLNDRICEIEEMIIDDEEDFNDKFTTKEEIKNAIVRKELPEELLTMKQNVIKDKKLEYEKANFIPVSEKSHSHKKICEELTKIYISKNSDYGDAFKNLKTEMPDARSC